MISCVSWRGQWTLHLTLSCDQSSVAKFKEAVNNLNVVNVVMKTFNGIVPLHWIVTDKTGETVVLEITKKEYHLYENKVVVMTNTPDFPWQLANLDQLQ